MATTRARGACARDTRGRAGAFADAGVDQERRDLRAPGRAHGLVVVGELARGAVREEAGVVGETPNLAARLVDSAPPDAVHVSGVTRSLTKDEFEWRDVGMAHLEGLSRAIHVYQVMSVRRREQAMEFGEKSGAATLAGREHEVSFLQERWRLVLEGAGGVIAITGEPGIGKSRLIRAFAEGLQAVDHRKVIFNCSPYHANSVFFPVADYLNRWLEKSDEDKLAQLANAAAALGLSAAEVVPIIASLLALPIVAPYRIPQVSARIQREMTMEILVEWIRRGADDRPTLLVVEDLHWSDASSLEFFFLLVNQIRTSRILMLLAFRPDFRAPALLHPHAAHLPLDRLTTSQVHEMIQQVAGEKRLSASVRDQLVHRTDGVPLSSKQRSKAVIESNVRRKRGRLSLPASSIDFDIPISLHATLMSRLDSLSSPKPSRSASWQAQPKQSRSAPPCSGGSFPMSSLPRSRPCPPSRSNVALRNWSTRSSSFSAACRRGRTTRSSTR